MPPAVELGVNRHSVPRGTVPAACMVGAMLVLAYAPGHARESPAPSDPRALIAAVVESYGGRAAVKRIASYRMSGRIVALGQGREGPTTRWFARPDRLRVEILYPDETEVRMVAAGRGWRSSGRAVESVRGPLLDAMLLQAGRAALPWILIERADRVRAIAPREHRGRPLEGIELELRPGLTLELYVDPATHRIEWSRGRLAHGGMETVFETVYGDFRRVHGVWFPFREENYASGVHTGYTAFEQVEVNPRLPAGAFGPPREEWKETEGTSWGGAD